MARWDPVQDRRGIVRRIKRRMHVKGLSQTDLAKLIDAARSSVSIALSETGEGWFSSEFLVRLPLVLDCSADWLFLGRGPETGAWLATNAASADGYLAALGDVSAFIDERATHARQESKRR